MATATGAGYGRCVFSTKVVALSVGLFLVGTTLVVVAMLRLSGTTTWPSRWVAIGLIVVLLIPIALLVLAASREGGEGEASGNFLDFLFGWWPW
jgi:multisubunit Na+/H+ antiporter MnhG subunit